MPYFIRQYTGLPYPDPNDLDAVNAFHLPASDQSLTTSILSLGTFLGALIAGDIADFIGRRTTIISGCLIFIVGCILETASTGLGLMCAGRVICGMGVGFISAIVILYMSVSNTIPSLFLRIIGKILTSTLGNRTKSCSWCCRGRISILYHDRNPSGQLCRLRDSEPRRYRFLSNPDRGPIPLGCHPRRRAILPPRVPTLLCQERQTRGGRQGSGQSPWAAH